jgi:hypothetical protein
MKIADLVFLLALLFVAIIRVAYHACRRRWELVRRIGLRAIGLVAAYLGIVVAVSLASPRQWVELNEEQRFDDWCVSIVDAKRTGNQFTVRARVSNRGRGRAQAARDASLFLLAVNGNRFELVTDPISPSLHSRIQAGESIETECRCELPPETKILGLDVQHGAWPEWFIVGDRGSLVHRRTLVRVEAIPIQ